MMLEENLKILQKIKTITSLSVTQIFKRIYYAYGKLQNEKMIVALDQNLQIYMV